MQVLNITLASLISKPICETLPKTIICIKYIILTYIIPTII